ncbi:hypothetical protein NX10_00915 [Pseudomonas fluorescens]|uniref:DUF4145 domain-containing protein n=1 Tax=Pseudomonas fluorescens TaxID=294 RepID=UPI0005859E10|nr:DUF4145 domain-containing protein [Pseudomonas fluorescens]KIF65453.1 hypothetical protein NX10_00915 [Pseudomonas fluorescens]
MKNGNSLALARCPHCNIAAPLLVQIANTETVNDRRMNARQWVVYRCNTCGGATMAVAPVIDKSRNQWGEVTDIWPTPQTVHDSIPDRAKAYLQQAIASIAAPSGAVMLTASAVDSMLKEKGYKEGSLYKRIDKAAADHLITAEMAAWAHEVRLDANDQRHVDDNAAMPDEADAQRSIEFTQALAQFLFVLPARVAEGRARV